MSAVMASTVAATSRPRQGGVVPVDDGSRSGRLWTTASQPPVSGSAGLPLSGSAGQRISRSAKSAGQCTTSPGTVCAAAGRVDPFGAPDAPDAPLAPFPPAAPG